MRRLLCCALLLRFGAAAVWPALGQAAPPPPDPALPVTVGRWTARCLRGGVFLDFDHVPLVRGGLVQLFSPDYAKGYYGSSSETSRPSVESLADGGRLYTSQYHYQADSRKFSATQRIEVHPNNRVLFSLRCRWDGPQPALLEWNAARIWAYPLIGATYRAEPASPAPQVPDRIGALPRGAAYPANSLAPPWQSLALGETAFGPMEIRVGPGEPAEGVLFDGRSDPYLRDDRLFWLGLLGAPLQPGLESARSFTLTIIAPPPAPAPPSALDGAAERGAARVVRIPDAARPLPPLVDERNHPLIIPEPKIARFPTDEREAFALTGRIVLTDQLPAGEPYAPVRQEIARFAAELKRATGAAVSLRPRLAGVRAISVEIGEGAAAATLPPEGYLLSVNSEEARIVGRDAAGAYYGIQTLRQLLRRRDGRFEFASASISDWPSLGFRGVHLFVGKEALPFHTRLAEQVLSRYKLNRLVLECEYARWRSHPEIAVPFGMSLPDLRADVAFARAHLLEPIPLVNSLGHSEWIFANHQHQDIVEDVASQHAYDAGNPNTYKFIFDIYSEALDIFHPGLFHIGHDEVKVPSQDREFGRYPARPENIKLGASALFIADANRLTDWLRQRGVGTILWGDMLLHESEGPVLPGVPVMTAANAPTPEEAARRRRAMPPGAVIADWRYTPGDEQRNGLSLFRQQGFQTLGCAWFQPENIRGWARQAIAHDSLGTLQTTWAGYDSSAAMLEEPYDYRQFTAYVLAAEYAWSGTARHPKDLFGRPFYRGYEPPPPAVTPATDGAAPAVSESLPYDAATIFNRAFRESPAVTRPRAGWYLSLRQAANVRLNENWPDGPALMAYRPATEKHSADSRDWPIEERIAPQIADVGIRTLGVRPGGILLHGLLNRELPNEHSASASPITYPAAMLLPVHARAANLYFLHATAFAAEDGASVGAYILRYADGGSARIPLRYGREIRALDDDTSAATLSTDPVHYGAPASPQSLRLYRWKNPRPAVEITAIEFREEHPYAAPILFGITGR